MEYGFPDTPPHPAERLHPPTEHPLPGREFAEAELAFSSDYALAEARRCLRCGPCSECRVCASSCGRRHIWVRIPGRGGEPPKLQMIRAPSAAALALESGAEASGSLVAGDGILGVDLFPARVRAVEELCRGCARCAEVCGFDAISFLEPDNPESKVRVDPTLCRGCNLCAAVCPTDALLPDLPPPRPDVLPRVEVGEEGPTVVFGCRQRAAELEPRLMEGDEDVLALWMRCIGEVDASMLLDLYERGAERIVVAGCPTDHCRYGKGTRMASVQAARAQTILRLLGADPDRISTEWPGPIPDRRGGPRALPDQMAGGGKPLPYDVDAQGGKPNKGGGDDK